MISKAASRPPEPSNDPAVRMPGELPALTRPAPASDATVAVPCRTPPAAIVTAEFGAEASVTVPVIVVAPA